MTLHLLRTYASLEAVYYMEVTSNSKISYYETSFTEAICHSSCYVLPVYDNSNMANYETSFTAAMCHSRCYLLPVCGK